MAITRMTLDQVKASPSRRDRVKLNATTQADIRRHAIENGDNPDQDLHESNIIAPGFIRKRLGMSQPVFARTIGVPVATLRNWEQNRVQMNRAAIALMRILAREPKATLRAARLLSHDFRTQRGSRRHWIHTLVWRF